MRRRMPVRIAAAAAVAVVAGGLVIGALAPRDAEACFGNCTKKNRNQTTQNQSETNNYIGNVGRDRIDAKNEAGKVMDSWYGPGTVIEGNQASIGGDNWAPVLQSQANNYGNVASNVGHSQGVGSSGDSSSSQMNPNQGQTGTPSGTASSTEANQTNPNIANTGK